ncbi:hypothetical protein [Streptomyces sp. NPDC085540]|uniref:hypothetical protein n=1 Tax=Streptomyces sp. NPDC085540 TaxID=3365730 RepID=UPI0037D76B19
MAIQQFLGHWAVSSTMRYVRPSATFIEDAHGRAVTTIRCTRLLDLVNTMDPNSWPPRSAGTPKPRTVYLADHVDPGCLPDLQSR